MHEPPLNVVELARREKLEQFVLTQKIYPSSSAAEVAFFGAAALVMSCGFGIVAEADSTATRIVVGIATTALTILVLEGAGLSRKNQLARPSAAVVYVFQRGLVREEYDGRLSLYPWSKVSARTRSLEYPMHEGRTYLNLLGDDGKKLGTFVDAERRLIEELKSS